MDVCTIFRFIYYKFFSAIITVVISNLPSAQSQSTHLERKKNRSVDELKNEILSGHIKGHRY